MTLQRRRLLVLLPYPPRLDATHGGSRMTAQLMMRLAAHHHVSLLCLRGPDDPAVDESLRRMCACVREVYRPGIEIGSNHAWRRRARFAVSQLSGRPTWATAWAVDAFSKQLQSVATRQSPDIIQAVYPIMGQYLPALRGFPAVQVLLEPDPGPRAAREAAQRQHGFRKLAAYFDMIAWERFERQLLRGVDAAVVFTKRDRDALLALSPTTPVAEIPFGTTWADRPLSPLGYAPPTLLFVGSFIHPPNVDAAVRLARNVFPRVRLHFPGVRLEVVGDRPPPEVRSLARDDIAILGRVPDVGPYLDRAAIVLAPLRLGGGMRVKVVEALAAGKALVASSLAVDGLDVTDGDQVVLAEGDEQLADAVVDLLVHPDRRAALATAARAWATLHLGWDRSIAALDALYEHLLERPRRP